MTEHMLYRMTTSNSIQKIFTVPLFVVMIGTFNIGIHDSPEATFEGIMAIVNIILKSALPTARVLVSSILPRHSVSLNAKIDKTNQLVAAALKDMDRVHFLQLDNLFKGTPYPEKLLHEDFYMPGAIFYYQIISFYILICEFILHIDHLHPSEDGYHAIVALIKTFLRQYDEIEVVTKELNISKTIVETLL